MDFHKIQEKKANTHKSQSSSLPKPGEWLKTIKKERVTHIGEPVHAKRSDLNDMYAKFKDNNNTKKSISDSSTIRARKSPF